MESAAPIGWAWTTAAAAVGCGIALLFGVFTALGGALAGGAVLWSALGSGSIAGSPPFGGWPAALYLASMCAAIVLLGPGAYSVDARLFGRREVFIPPSARDSKNAQRDHRDR